MSASRIALGLLLVAAPLWAVGCSGFADAGEARAYCASDDDCGEPFICVFGACYDPGDAAFQQVSFEVVPAALSRAPTQQFRDFVVNGQSRSELILAPTVDAHFLVLSGAGAALQSLITAETPNDIPGRPLRVDEQSGSDGRGVLDLVSGRSYNLRVLPDDDTEVPFRPPTIFANSDIDGPQNGITLEAPAPEELLTVTGRTVVSVSDNRGIPNLRVQVLAPVGTPAEMRVVSTTGLSQDPTGAFSVELPSDFNSNLTLRVAPTEVNPYFPVVQIEGLDLTGDSDLGLIEIGNIGSPLVVTGKVDGPSGPESGATITFVGDVGAGSYSASTVTQEDGSYSLYLLWGLYGAVAAPPASSRAGLTELPEPVLVDLPGSGVDEVDFSAQPRAKLNGVVRLFDAVPIIGATVRASRLSNAEEVPGPGDAVRTVFETTTGLEGEYELRLDPGRFELSVIPPDELVAPRRTDVIVIGLTGLRHDVALYDPAPFGGRVLSEATGDPVLGALVRAFVVLPDQRVMMVGEELTDDGGEFNLVLPVFTREEE